MLVYLKLLFGCTLLTLLTGCSGFFKYMEDMQKQSVDDFDKRSVYFQPKFQLEAPKRTALSPEEQRLVGAPPPQQGEVLLDGVRYYSANGHICQYFITRNRQPEIGSKSACYINGRWVLAAPVLNTDPIKP